MLLSPKSSLFFYVMVVLNYRRTGFLVLFHSFGLMVEFLFGGGDYSLLQVVNPSCRQSFLDDTEVHRKRLLEAM